MATRNDPYAAFNFLVSLPSLGDDPNSVVAGFSQVSGLNQTLSYMEYRNGNDKSTVTRKIPGLTQYDNIVLQRGVIGDTGFWQWINDGANPDSRTDGTITLLNENRESVLRWRFRRALPVRVTGPTFNATASEIALESLELTHEGLRVEND